jgi:hypothetical protein
MDPLRIFAAGQGFSEGAYCSAPEARREALDVRSRALPAR